MFVGHYAAALAVKAAEPRAPLWSYIVGCQLLDYGWSALVLADIEHLRIDPTLLGSHFDLYDMPWTHSLPAAVIWSLGAALLMRGVFRIPVVAAAAVGFSVFSHWLLDLAVHRPDLLIWPGGQKVGFALWNYPLPEMILELGMLAVAAIAWTGRRKSEGRRAWPAAIFVTVLLILQYVSIALPASGPATDMARTALIAYVAVAALAWGLDRGPVKVLRS
jgi:hypothetical protein